MTLGRSPEHLKILPGAFVVVGDTLEEARAKSGRSSTASCITTARLRRCRSRLGTTLRDSIRMARCREIPESNASKSGRERVVELAQRETI